MQLIQYQNLIKAKIDAIFSNKIESLFEKKRMVN
jgi:hypothetical protein